MTIKKNSDDEGLLKNVVSNLTNAKKLLIVEDEASVAADLADELSNIGYDVCGIANNGKEAIELTRLHKPDLVLMDIVITGEMDGIQTAAVITKSFGAAVIFLTAYNDSEIVRRAAETVPYGFLTKPYQFKELHAIIEVARYKYILEKHLRESERWFSDTLRCVADGVIALDKQGLIRFMNSAAEKMTYLQLEKVSGQEVNSVIKFIDNDGNDFNSSFMSVLENNALTTTRFGLYLSRPDNSRLPIDQSAAPIRNDIGEPIGIVLVIRDVSDRIVAEEALRSSEERFRTAFDLAATGLALVGMDGRFLQGNKSICDLLKCTQLQLQDLNQKDITHIDDLVTEELKLNSLLSESFPAVQFEKRYCVNENEIIWTLVSVSLLKSKDTATCFLYQIHDVSLRKQYELQLAQQALHDALTGLPNRISLNTELQRLINSSHRHDRRFGVLFIDLDYFKEVNDTLGHEAGDQLLRIVADRLQNSIRASDFACRLGGDEFVVLITEVDSTNGVNNVVDKLLKEFRNPITIQGSVVHTSLSVGISLFPQDGDDATTLLQCADSALYQAKAEGRDNAQFHRPELTRKLRQRISLENELKQAIEQEQFEIYYQPVVPTSSNIAFRAEALIRWRHPTKGIILPGEFIGLTEESGLIVPMGRWVIDKGCQDATKWPNINGKKICLSINVSIRQFRLDDIIDTVSKALQQSKLAPERLCLEISEQLLVHDTTKTLKMIIELKNIGVEIAIEDFGIGFSSLSYIRRFQPQKIKIDKALVQTIGISEQDNNLVAAVIAMGLNLDMTVIAEGVETEEQRNHLVKQGCKYIQGYLYAQPMPYDAFIHWLSQRNAVQSMH